MVPEQCLFILRLVVYWLLWPLSFVCWIPLCIVAHYNQGYCLLYTNSASYGPVSACGYTITVPIIFSLLYAGYMAFSNVFKLTFYNKRGYIEETMVEFVTTVIVDGLSWIFMFVNAGIISAGFNSMCWNLFGTISTCSEGVLRQSVFGTYSTFYCHLKIAEVSAWLSWLLWLAQFYMGLIALWRSGVMQKSNESCFRYLPCQPRCTCVCKMRVLRPPEEAAMQRPLQPFQKRV